MLNKEVIKDMLSNKEYNKIIDYFEDEYKEIFMNFLVKKNIHCTEEESMVDVMNKIEINYPQYSGIITLVSLILLDENLSIGDRIEKLIDNYNIVLKRLT